MKLLENAVEITAMAVKGGADAAPLAAFEGAITDQTPGWTFKPSQADAKGMSRNASEGYYPDRGGTLQSSKINLGKDGVKAGAWYKLSFDAKTDVHCYWGVSFYHADGKPFIADHNDKIFTGDRQHYVRYFYASDEATDTDIFFIAKTGIEVWDIVIEKATAAEAAAGCDEIYAKMPAGLETYFPDGKATALLPKTAAALRQGKPWRIIMLGDSIVNDTYNSNFQCLIPRAFPNSKVEYVASVRGITGVMYYQEPENFQTFVADLKPDLLIIGGISNANGVTTAESKDAYRKIVGQAKPLGCEILLMTTGNAQDTRCYNPGQPDLPLPASQWTASDALRAVVINKDMQTPEFLSAAVGAFLEHDFANSVHALGKELNLPVLDETTPAYSYVHASGKPWGFFARDAIHSNCYGKQINGRILANLLAH